MFHSMVVQLKTNIGAINVLVLPLENAFSGMSLSTRKNSVLSLQ